MQGNLYKAIRKVIRKNLESQWEVELYIKCWGEKKQTNKQTKTNKQIPKPNCQLSNKNTLSNKVSLQTHKKNDKDFLRPLKQSKIKQSKAKQNETKLCKFVTLYLPYKKC